MDATVFPAMEMIPTLSPIHRNIIARANELEYFPSDGQVRLIQQTAGQNYLLAAQSHDTVATDGFLDEAIERVMNCRNSVDSNKDAA
jgi:hypothetical protein